MNILQFLFGKNLSDSAVSLQPGTFYLDIEKNELWYDDPSNTSKKHNKIIDVDTLKYEIVSKNIEYPSAGEEDADLNFVVPK